MEIKTLVKNINHFNGVICNYAVFIIGKKKSVLLKYPAMTALEKNQLEKAVKEGREDKFIKPEGVVYIDAKTVDEIGSDYEYRFSYYGGGKYKEVSGPPKDYGLYIPKPYANPKITFKTSIDPLINNKLLESLKASKFNYPIVIIGEDYGLINKTNSNNYYRYICTRCNTEFSATNNKYHYEVYCPTCGHENYDNQSVGPHHRLILKDFKNHKENEFNGNKLSVFGAGEFGNSAKQSFYYFSKHPDNPNGIMIYKIVHSVDTRGTNIIENFKIEYIVEHIVGEKMVAYKNNKTGLKEVDPLVALNINSRNINSNLDVLYDDANDFYEFAIKNEKFLKMSGFLSALKFASKTVNLQAFFIVYIGLVNKYPILEQIIKMGHAKLFFNLYNCLTNSASQQEILQHANEISEIVNTESHGGKDILRFPIYIGEYLIQKNATLEEYYYWRDLYELTHLTKEQFYNLTESFNYAIIHGQSGLQSIGNILKFGYSIEKLMGYIVKTSRKNNVNTTEIIFLLIDYLNMCDILQITPDLFPQDLKKQHDDIANKFKEREKMEYDAKLNQIGIECEKYVIPNENELNNVGIPKLFNELTIVFPKCEVDFINEGNQQHNCVGSYPNKVRNGNSVVFFIRKKSEPEKSFITAECVRNGLGQCYYSNNRYVEKKDLIAFAKYIANKIRAGVASKQIHALNNI